jgi:hypothetical protein
MTAIDYLKAFGVAVAILVVNVAISFAVVALYSYAVDPGHDEAYYQAAAQWIAPWSSIAFGWLLFLIVTYVLSRSARNALAVALTLFAAYAALDLGILASAGQLAAIAPIVAVSLASNLVGAIAGVWLAHVMFDLPVLELSAHARHGMGQWVAEIIATFGDIYKYVRPDGQLDPRWQTDFLARIRLPFPLRLAWDGSQTIHQMTCHRRVASVFASVFASIQQQGLQARVSTFGGCFAFRPQRTGSRLSAHSWGIAIDLNPRSNVQGSAGDMNAGGHQFSLIPDAGGRCRNVRIVGEQGLAGNCPFA